MEFHLETAHGIVSIQPDGRIEFRKEVGPWETLKLVEHGPVKQPTPIPIDDPLLGCDPMLRGLGLVQCLWSRIQPAGSVEKAFDVTRRVAWGLRSLGVGLLIKDGGENVVTWQGKSYSASRICWPDGRIVKVLSDVPTTNGPSWQDGGTVDPSFWSPALDPRS